MTTSSPSPKNILITGAQGFIGSNLKKHFVSQGEYVEGPDFDLFESEKWRALLKGRPWDFVFHLAALSHVPTCEKDPKETFRVNQDGSELLATLLRECSPKTKLVFFSTAQVYRAPSKEEISQELSFSEQREIAPQNIYAQSKWGAEKSLCRISEETGLETTIFRLFNHSHYTQSPQFFLPHLYCTLTEGKGESVVDVPVGNLDLWRDIGSLQDLLKALDRLMSLSCSKPFEVFNLCSGHAKNLRVLAEVLAKELGVKARFHTDPSRVRENEAKYIRGDHQKFSEWSGWKPKSITEQDLVKAFCQKI